MSFETVKSGWLQRCTSVLHRWKKSWFVLNREGVLRVFDSPDSHTAEKAIRIQTDCVYVNTAAQLTEVVPPSGVDKNCLLQIVLRDKRLVLCAESPDDASAWQLALEDARVISNGPPPGPSQVHVLPPPGYTPQYSTVSTTTVYPQQTQVVYPRQGTTTTVYPQQQVAYTYPGQAMYGSQPPSQVVVNPAGNHTTVIYRDNSRYRNRYCNDDFYAGMMMGAMWMPLWYW